jgi:hypothetical protein
MTAIAHQPLQRTNAELGVPAMCGALAVRWEISPSALLESRSAAILNGQAARLRACALVMRVDERAVRAELALELAGGEYSRLTLTEAMPVVRTVRESIATCDAAGVLTLVVRTVGERCELLYANTSVLCELLGLPGGVYDAPGLEPRE